MSRHECFVIEVTPRYQRSLRRFNLDTGTCPAGGIHNAEVIIDQDFIPLRDDPQIEWSTLEGAIGPIIGDIGFDHSDPRWPKVCEKCSYPFKEDDWWQVVYHHIYEGGGYVGTRHDAPPGALWDADWLKGWDDTFKPGPDGKIWEVKLPGKASTWVIDGTSIGGGFWYRDGTAPKFTVSPSILVKGYYHGFLTNGVLESTPDSPA